MSDFKFGAGDGGLFEAAKKRIKETANVSDDLVTPEAYWWLAGRILGKLVEDRWTVIRLDRVSAVEVEIESKAVETANTAWTRTLVIDYPGGPAKLSAGYDSDAEAFIDKVLAALSQ